MTASFTAILLAGDRPADALAQISPGKRKALLLLRGQPMILYVLKTVLASPHIRDIIIVANNAVDIESNETISGFITGASGSNKVSFREGADSPAASVLKTMEELSIVGPVLVTTADNPLLSLATLNDFCEAVGQGEPADAVVGLARESDIRKAFPRARRTFIRLAREGYSGCNLFALTAGAGPKAARAWTQVESHRKKRWKFILHFGVFTLLRALFGLLDLKGAMAAVSRTIQLRAKAIVLNDPVAAMDVDRLEHVQIAEEVLGARDMNALSSAP